MEKLIEQAALLDQLTKELQQATFPGAGPAVLARLSAHAATVKATAQDTLSNLRDQCRSKAATLRAKAAELKQKQEAAAAAAAPMEAKVIPYPWEDHQGLGPAEVASSADALVQQMRQALARRRH